MKTALIFTLQWSDNYGTVLQAYALQQALKSLGVQGVVAPVYPESDGLTRRFVGRSLSATVHKWRNLYWKSRRSGWFSDFRRRYFDYGGLSPIVRTKISKCDFSCFDALVFGSDNIWGAENRIDGRDAEVFFALGIRHGNKIAYAPSSGGNLMIDPLRNVVVDLVRRGGFRKISCREQSSVTAFLEAGILSVRVPDPTLLVSAVDWHQIEEPIDGASACVFGYDLGHVNERRVRDVCLTLADGDGRKMSVCYPNDWSKNEKQGIPMTPGQWVWRVRSARCVVSNSFHGVVFSIIFHKPFLYLPISGEKSRQNGRADEMLDLCGLQARRLESGRDCKAQMESEINWDLVEERLKPFREKGFDFLRENI